MKSTASSARDSDLTRNIILQAARDLFSEQGFETVGVRTIGARAGVDPALISRYFGGKDELFVEVVKAGRASWGSLWGRSDDFPERATHEILRGPKGGVVLRDLIVLMRSSVSKRAHKLIEEALGASIFQELENWLGGANADVRARFLICLLTGMAFARDLDASFELSEGRLDVLGDYMACAIGRILKPGDPG